MKYILDNSGYVESASCNPISCDDKVSQEYTGTIPDGYETLDEWILYANIRAYKIVNNNLVYDAAKDAELQEEWANTGQNIPPVILFKNSTNGDITLRDDISNYKYIEVIYGNESKKIGNSTKVPTYFDAIGLICAVTTNGHMWVNTTEYTLSGKKLTISRCGNNDVDSTPAINYSATTSAITVYEVLGYK